MALIDEIKKRSAGKCEICTSNDMISAFAVAPFDDENAEHSVMICDVCKDQITENIEADSNHWRCLNESIWSEVNAVKVISYRMLHRLKGEGWPTDLLDMIYLEEDILAWAQKGLDEDEGDKIIHKDSNGATLDNGDSVVLIKDLVVKGANFTAKRGTAVRNISLVFDNAEQIEGRVNGQHIVILTQFVKKSS